MSHSRAPHSTIHEKQPVNSILLVAILIMAIIAGSTFVCLFVISEISENAIDNQGIILSISVSGNDLIITMNDCPEDITVAGVKLDIDGYTLPEERATGYFEDSDKIVFKNLGYNIYGDRFVSVSAIFETGKSKLILIRKIAF